MCSVYGMNPCHPSCPNAPEPVPVYECCRCGYGILEGDKFWDSPAGYMCEDCVDEMDAKEILEMCGESLTEAKKGGNVNGRAECSSNTAAKHAVKRDRTD